MLLGVSAFIDWRRVIHWILVVHGSEIAYVYGQLAVSSPGSSQQLSKQMTDYWISLVVSQDPNDGKGAERPEWPRFTANDKVTMFPVSANFSSSAFPDSFAAEWDERH